MKKAIVINGLALLLFGLANFVRASDWMSTSTPAEASSLSNDSVLSVMRRITELKLLSTTTLVSMPLAESNKKTNIKSEVNKPLSIETISGVRNKLSLLRSAPHGQLISGTYDGAIAFHNISGEKIKSINLYVPFISESGRYVAGKYVDRKSRINSLELYDYTGKRLWSKIVSRDTKVVEVADSGHVVLSGMDDRVSFLDVKGESIDMSDFSHLMLDTAGFSFSSDGNYLGLLETVPVGGDNSSIIELHFVILELVTGRHIFDTRMSGVVRDSFAHVMRVQGGNDFVVSVENLMSNRSNSIYYYNSTDKTLRMFANLDIGHLKFPNLVSENILCLPGSHGTYFLDKTTGQVLSKNQYTFGEVVLGVINISARVVIISTVKSSVQLLEFDNTGDVISKKSLLSSPISSFFNLSKNAFAVVSKDNIFIIQFRH